jgi:hypothetical protein
MPLVFDKLSETFVSELSKGAAGSFKAIPLFFDDEDSATLLFPPQRRELIEVIQKSMAAHGVARDSIAALPFLKLCMTSMVKALFNEFGLYH